MLPLLLALLCPAEKPRNVVLLIADDLGLQLGCYGDRAAKTPQAAQRAADAYADTMRRLGISDEQAVDLVRAALRR